MNVDANIHGLPYWLQLPAWLSLVRACTLGQIARYLYQGQMSDAETAVEVLVRRKRYVGKVGPIKLPGQFGPAANKLTHVYYLTQKGHDALARVSQDFTRHAKPGRPVGANRYRLPHELLIAEAWLWQIAQGREVLEFLPETELKRQLIMRRSADEVHSVAHSTLTEATGDFKLRLRDVETQAEFWIQGEAAVRYSPSQISAKPDHMDWFCCDERVALLIETRKGAPPYLLGDVRSPDLSEPIPQKRSGRAAPTRDNILSAIQLLGGAITATCAQAMLGVPRNYAARVLKGLYTARLLQAYKTSIRLGVDEGRPIILYTDPALVLRTAPEIAHRTWVTKMVVDAWRKGFEVKQFDLKLGLLTLQAEDNPTVSVKTIVDSPSISVGQLYSHLEAVAPTAAARARVAVAMADPIRMTELRRFFPEVRIHNLATPIRAHLSESQSAPATMKPMLNVTNPARTASASL